MQILLGKRQRRKVDLLLVKKTVYQGKIRKERKKGEKKERRIRKRGRVEEWRKKKDRKFRQHSKKLSIAIGVSNPN